MSGTARGLTPREAARAGAELAGLWAVAVAWPVFQGATSGADALTAIGAGPGDVLLFGALTLLAGPIVLLLVEVAVALVSKPARRWLHAFLLGVAVGLVIWQAVLRDTSAPDAVSLAVIAAAAIGFAWLYERFEYIRNFSSILGFAVPVVAVLFLISGPVSNVVFDGGDEVEGEPIAESTPVVMLLFDEFPLASITDRPGHVDSANFPNFARLASESDWYTNARTQSDATIQAVPMILTGRSPAASGAEPSSKTYPQNLFTVLGSGGYSVDAVEPVTHLCPSDLCESRLSGGRKLKALVENGLEAGRPWPMTGQNDGGELLVEAFSTARAPEFDDFIGRLGGDDRKLSFLHTLLPHYMWQYLPTGLRIPLDQLSPATRVDSPIPEIKDRDGVAQWSASKHEMEVTWQQVMLQTQYVDRQVGRVMDALRSSGAWEKTLFIATADHGGSYERGTSWRGLDESSKGWIAPVPLFVKFPGQTTGQAVDRTVFTKDVFPTILDELGVEPPGDVDGTVLGSRSGKIDDYTANRGGATEIRLDENEIRRAYRDTLRQRDRLFGRGGLFFLAGRDDLEGTDVGAGNSGLEAVGFSLDAPELLEDVDPAASDLPAFISGSIETDGTPDLAFALNGKVVGTAGTWKVDGTTRFAFTLPPEAFDEGANEVTVYRLPGT